MNGRSFARVPYPAFSCAPASPTRATPPNTIDLRPYLLAAILTITSCIGIGLLLRCL